MRGTAIHLPTEVEWVLWDGMNFDEVKAFVEDEISVGKVLLNKGVLELLTRQGSRWPRPGDRIVKGTMQELYFITPDVWGKTYGTVVTTA